MLRCGDTRDRNLFLSRFRVAGVPLTSGASVAVPLAKACICWAFLWTRLVSADLLDSS